MRLQRTVQGRQGKAVGLKDHRRLCCLTAVHPRRHHAQATGRGGTDEATNRQACDPNKNRWRELTDALKYIATDGDKLNGTWEVEWIADKVRLQMSYEMEAYEWSYT